MSRLKKKSASAATKRAIPGHINAKKNYKKYSTILETMQEDSQIYLILKHLLEKGSITQKEAEKKPIYSRRLGARIYDLRHDYKIPIETEMIYKKRGKKTIPHASYYIGA